MHSRFRFLAIVLAALTMVPLPTAGALSLKEYTEHPFLQQTADYKSAVSNRVKQLRAVDPALADKVQAYFYVSSDGKIGSEGYAKFVGTCNGIVDVSNNNPGEVDLSRIRIERVIDKVMTGQFPASRSFAEDTPYIDATADTTPRK